MMRKSKNHRYEVVVELNGKANIDGHFGDEKMAEERAKYLLRQAKYSSVRVVQFDKNEREKVIFDKSSTGGGKNTTISTIDSSPYCEDAWSVYGFDSRMTLAKLYRKYLDEEVAIPAEQLHRYFPLRYFEREALLFNPGISLLAKVQSEQHGLDPDKRYDQLIRLFEEVKTHADKGKAEIEKFGRILTARGIPGLTDAVASLPVGQRDRAITGAVSFALEDRRDWGGKVAFILKSYDDDLDDSSMTTIDELLTEIIDGREPIRALIGYAPDLSAAILSMLAAYRGELDDQLPHTAEFLQLSDAIGGGRLPRVGAALINRVEGGLSGSHPLTRTGGAAEARGFDRIVGLLSVPGGYIGGASMAAALTRRAKLAWRTGSHDLSFEESVARLSHRLAGPGARVGYLLDLAQSDFGRKKASHLMKRVVSEFDTVDHARELVPECVPLDEFADGFFRRLRAAGVPRPLAKALVARFDEPYRPAARDRGHDVLDRFIAVEEGRRTARSVEVPSATALRAVPKAGVEVRYRGRIARFETPGDRFTIGSAQPADIVVEGGRDGDVRIVIYSVGGDFFAENLSCRKVISIFEKERKETFGSHTRLAMKTYGAFVIPGSARSDQLEIVQWKIVTN